MSSKDDQNSIEYWKKRAEEALEVANARAQEAAAAAQEAEEEKRIRLAAEAEANERAQEAAAEKRRRLEVEAEANDRAQEAAAIARAEQAEANRAALEAANARAQAAAAIARAEQLEAANARAQAAAAIARAEQAEANRAALEVGNAGAQAAAAAIARAEQAETNRAALEAANARAEQAEAAAREAAAAAREAAADAKTAKINVNLVNLVTESFFSVGSFEFAPEGVVVRSDVMTLVEDLVRIFGKKETNERTGSIRDPSSVHHFWAHVIKWLRDDCVGAVVPRVLYECLITNPYGYRDAILDFALTPPGRCHSNWTEYLGGLEAKTNPRMSSRTRSPLQGAMATDGLKQALSRAALSVMHRWRRSGCTGHHRSYCCFADACRFGIARVRLEENGKVYAEMCGPMDLPGHNNSRDDTPLRILKFILSATTKEELSELLWSSTQLPEEEEASITGRVEVEGAGKVDTTWKLGQLIGRGGFGSVYTAIDDASVVPSAGGAYEQVIKVTPMRDSLKSFDNEEKKLRILKDRLSDLVDRCALPRLVGTLTKGDQPIALKLSPRGVELSRYIRLTNPAEVCDYRALALVARKVGVALVDTLQRVHEVGIAHGDIRVPNVLLVPRDDELLRHVNGKFRDMDECDALRDIDINDCAILLNDWGNAVQLDGNRDSKVTEDLKMVVNMIRTLGSAVDTDVLIKTPRSSYIPPVIKERSTDGDRRTNALFKAAEQHNYSKMIQLLEAYEYANKLVTK
jgi:hypothetical protein